jgi:hypothetical protein
MKLKKRHAPRAQTRVRIAAPLPQRKNAVKNLA